ncbi:MAG: GntR family transcriptional regulator [Actinomycetota bacterium]
MSESLAAQATEALKDLLISCALEPGGCYTEAAISDRLGLGKTPVREALTLLVNRGWLKPTKGRGYEVLPPTFDAMRDLFATRQLLEPSAARMGAGRLDEHDAARLLTLCSPDPDSSTPEGRLVATKLHRDLHLGIVAAAGNEVLTDLVKLLLDQTSRLAFLVLSAGGWDGAFADTHLDLVNAMIDGDGPLAEALLAEHILESEQAAYAVLQGETSLGRLARRVGGAAPAEAPTDDLGIDRRSFVAGR